jgi:hypothetical protein
MFHYQGRHELVWTIALTQLTTIQREATAKKQKNLKELLKSKGKTG